MALTKQEILKMIQDLQDQADALVGQGEYKLADQRLKRIKELKEQLKHMKDSMEVLKLSGFSVKDEEVSPKFKKVMKEFGKGELKSSSGEKVTDPKQAKAIAYSEAGEAKDSTYNYTEGDYKEEYKRLVQKRNNAQQGSPEYKKIQERLNTIRSKIKGSPFDSKDGGPGSGIKGHHTEKKPSSYYTHRAEAQNRLLSDVDEIKYKYKKEGKKLSHGKLLQELGNYGWENYELEGLKLPLNLDAKDDDATKEGAIKEYGKEKGKFEDGWKHYRDSKGNIWELVNAQGSFWMMECIKGPRKGDTVTFRKEVVESSMTEDSCNNKDACNKDSCGEKVYTKGTEDGGPGSGIKGHTTPEEQSSKSNNIKYDQKEIDKIKKSWEGKETVGGHGSEYGDILDYLKGVSKDLPDEDEYFKLSDKLIDMRKAGKKDTPEYKEVEKKRNDFNKTYNKVHKALEEKAKSLVSEKEKKRLDELKGVKSKSMDADPKLQEAQNIINMLGGVK